MTASIDRTLFALELLSRHPQGLAVQDVAVTLGIAPSAAHRLLNDLRLAGFVRQNPQAATYGLTMRLAALGLSWLGRTGIPDICQPVLDDLAEASGELVRLSVADGDRLIWVAFAQGATTGLRYDPAREQGAEASLAYSASGRAWAATLDQDQAARLLAQQGLTPPQGAAENQQLSSAQALALFAEARTAGFAEAVDCFLAGMAAVAVPLPAAVPAIGCLSIAGPAVRLTQARRRSMLPALFSAAQTIADLFPASDFFRGAR